MNAHKLIALCLVFMLVITACAHVATNTHLPISTATTIPSLTQIPQTATVQLTATFVASQFVATPTLDPRFGSKPMPDAGFTVYQNMGTFQWTERDANGKNERVWSQEFGTWERNLNLEGKPIQLMYISNESRAAGFHDQIWLQVNISDRVSGFDKVGLLSLHIGTDNLDVGKSFRNQFIADLKRKADPGPIFLDIDQDKVSIPFTTIEGPQIWKLGPNTKVVVDILDKPIGNGFIPWDDMYGPSNSVFQVRLFADQTTGDLHVQVVPGMPVDQLSKEQWAEILLYGPAQIIQNSDQRVAHFSSYLSTYVVLLTNPQYPAFFDMGPSQ